MEIILQDCGKSFNRKWLFRHVDCTLKLGEKWVILGANGSGKSTFCLMLCAQVWPTEGTVEWQKDHKKINAESVFSYISLASPAMELAEEFTFKEIIEMHHRVKPLVGTSPFQTIKEICGFDDKTMNKPLFTYSSGMKQRARLSLAALSNTPVLLLDEPLTNLDKAGAETYKEIIANYTNNRLVIIASNREDEYEFCTKSLHIQPDGTAVKS